MRKKMFHTMMLAGMLGMGAFALAGCEQDAGDSVDDAAENVEDAAEDAADAASDAVDDAADAVDDAVDDATSGD